MLRAMAASHVDLYVYTEMSLHTDGLMMQFQDSAWRCHMLSLASLCDFGLRDTECGVVLEHAFRKLQSYACESRTLDMYMHVASPNASPPLAWWGTGNVSVIEPGPWA